MGAGRNDGATFGKENRAPGTPLTIHGDAGSAARFFNELPPDNISDGRGIHRARFVYFAKPTKAEKNYGIDGPEEESAAFDHRPTKRTNPEKWANIDSPHARVSKRKNNHPTVKRKALMIWLIRLITPPGGTVLDAFMGSGTTAVAAIETGHPFIGIEKDRNSFYISVSRALAAPAPLFPDSQPSVFESEQ